MTDVVSRTLESLPGAELDADRAERLRRRCQVELRRHAQPAPAGRRWAQPLLGSLSAVYVAAAIYEALLFYGWV